MFTQELIIQDLIIPLGIYIYIVGIFLTDSAWHCSCSVCYLAKVFAESLRDQFLKDYADSDDKVYKFKPKEVLCAQLAGLCHDLGICKYAIK